MMENHARTLPGPVAEAAGFARLRRRTCWTLTRQSWKEHTVRSLVILVITSVFWIGMFYLFRFGFRLMNLMIAHEGTRAEVVHAALNVFFVSLLAMMTLSSGILTYSLLYRTHEVRFLLTLPIRPHRIVYHKFQETLLVGSWGLLLLGTPLLVAYGTMASSPWYFYVLLLPFLALFAVLPIALGAILCILVMRYMARLRLHALGVIAVTALLLAGAVAWSAVREAKQQDLSTAWFQMTLRRLQYAEQRWLPSWWLSSGLLEAAHPATSRTQTSWQESLGFFAVISANALMVYWLLGVAAKRWFVGGYTRLAELGSARRAVEVGRIDRLLWLITRPFPGAMRLLLIKDLRIFRRDPLQWLQFGIFFGLLAFYFLNVRRLHRHNTEPTWMMSVGYLNVSVVGLLLATFTTRFIYPLVSLEGRRFWVLGTLPLSRRDIVWGKFWFASMISLTPCLSLVLLSDIMLQLANDSALVVASHLLTSTALCLGLCGIAVGLGARFPNLRESTPAKIASGFGGTMTLVLSISYIIATVLCGALPTYWWFAEQIQGIAPNSWWRAWGLGSFPSVIAGMLGTIVLGTLGTLLPLHIGLRAFGKQEL